MPGNRSITDFFGHAQPVPQPVQSDSQSDSRASSAPSLHSRGLQPQVTANFTKKPTIKPFPLVQAKSVTPPASSITTKPKIKPFSLGQGTFSNAVNQPAQTKPSTSDTTEQGLTSTLSLPSTSSITRQPEIKPFAMGQGTSSNAINQPAQTHPSTSNTTEQGHTSSLSPPLATAPSPSIASPSLSSDRASPIPISSQQQENVPLPPVSSKLVSTSSDRVIQNSDDSDEDSDSSLEDLSALLAAKTSDIRVRQSKHVFTPSTPAASRQQTRRSANFHTSPLPVLSKYKFDMKHLVENAARHEAAEASSKRVKAMMAPKDEDIHMTSSDHGADHTKFSHAALLESVVADREDGGAHKVTRAIMRTEATVTEKACYFFEMQSKATKPKRKSFPSRSVPENWRRELVDPKMRYQTFVSGFAADMVTFGKKLPDELFLWILEEACVEDDGPLRMSYFNTIRESKEQITRLLNQDVVKNIFLAMGGCSTSVEIGQKLVPVQKLTQPYPKRDWASLLSVIQFLGLIGKRIRQNTGTYIISMLLRMSFDRMVFENVDLLTAVQDTIARLCLYTPEDDWETCCQEICKPLFDCVELPTLRLQILESLSSIIPRTHDLRRRLAMCFYFNDSSHCKEHSHSLLDLDAFIRRLNNPAFDTNSETDYRELAALITLLDIAVDDGRSTKVDLNDKEVARRFDEDIEELGAAVKNIMRGIGNPGAAFLSRIEAKEVLELVSQRISDTLRSKPKAKQTWFDKMGKREEDLDAEKKGMESFISRVKSISSGANSQPSTTSASPRACTPGTAGEASQQPLANITNKKAVKQPVKKAVNRDQKHG